MTSPEQTTAARVRMPLWLRASFATAGFAGGAMIGLYQDKFNRGAAAGFVIGCTLAILVGKFFYGDPVLGPARDTVLDERELAIAQHSESESLMYVRIALAVYGVHELMFDRYAWWAWAILLISFIGQFVQMFKLHRRM